MKLKVLVVDDEPSLHAMVLRFLSMNHYEAQSASSGKEALQMIEDEEFQIVLTDIKMPEMNGITLMKMAKAIKPELLFIVMTGFGSLDSAIEAMKLGAINFIKKPINMVELVKTMKRAEALLVPRNFNIHVQRYIRREEGSIEMSALEVSQNTEYLSAFFAAKLEGYGFSPAEIDNIRMALFESLNNSIEHGSLQLNKAFKQQDEMERYQDFLSERDELLKDPLLGGKKIQIGFEFSESRFSLQVSDTGSGFDTKDLMGKIRGEEAVADSSRGLFLIDHLADEVSFNEKGNEIRMTWHKL